MYHGAMRLAAAAVLATGLLSATALPAQATPRRGCGLRAGQTIGAQVKGSGTVYCVMAEAKDVTLTVDLLQNGALVAHRTKTVTLVPPTLTVPVSYTCTVGDTYQTTATWGKTVHTTVVTATSC
jgi:hypothetical protein